MNAEEAKSEARAAAEGADLVERIAERLGAQARTTAVFGEPVEREGVTVIPVARAAWGFGGGSGGEGTDQQGSGGGGGVVAKPVGYIEVRADGAEFRSLRSSRDDLVAAGIGAGLLLLAASVFRRR